MVVVDRAVPKVLFSSTPGRGLGEVTERFNAVISFERMHGLHCQNLLLRGLWMRIEGGFQKLGFLAIETQLSLLHGE